uniref:Putative WD40 repeat-like protein n=1 Tax=Moniliophthora roreri TaxID=221103 RepID=A0A0W0F4B2_MONRR
MEIRTSAQSAGTARTNARVRIGREILAHNSVRCSATSSIHISVQRSRNVAIADTLPVLCINLPQRPRDASLERGGRPDFSSSRASAYNLSLRSRNTSSRSQSPVRPDSPDTESSSLRNANSRPVALYPTPPDTSPSSSRSRQERSCPEVHQFNPPNTSPDSVHPSRGRSRSQSNPPDSLDSSYSAPFQKAIPNRARSSPDRTLDTGGGHEDQGENNRGSSTNGKCSCTRGKGRNLVVCIDGTSNQFGAKNTNVVELYSRIPKNEHQLTFYNSGIGTYARPSWKSLSYYKQVIGHKLDLAIAWRFERILLSAYRWLSETYEPGDRIFLFGFSRGAYQVRALSAMIEKVGLIQRGNEDQIAFAYELYCASSDDTDEQVPAARSHSLDAQGSTVQPASKFSSRHPDRTQGDQASRFKMTFSVENVKIHFVGAWDTVSSVGLVRSDKDLPLTTLGMKHVCYFRHALALDERRVKFLPEFVRGGLGPRPEECRGEQPHTKEVWFAGTHSDIGGGNTENAGLNTNGPSLRWMSVYWATGPQYKNRLPPRWQDQDNTAHIEPDSADQAAFCLSSIVNELCRTDKERKRQVIFKRIATVLNDVENVEDLAYGDHYQSLFQPTEVIEQNDPNLIRTRSTMSMINAIWDEVHRQGLCTETVNLRDMPPVIQTLLERPEAVGEAKRFLSRRCSPVLGAWSQRFPVNCVAVSPDGKFIAWGYGRQVVIRELETLANHAVVSGHPGQVTCIAFSPDSAKIISGSTMVFVNWLASHAHRCRPYREPVSAVAFDASGTYFLSASRDGTACLQACTSGKVSQIIQRYKPGGGAIHDAVFSPDDTKVVTGSEDGSISVFEKISGEKKIHLTPSQSSITCVSFLNREVLTIVAGTDSGVLYSFQFSPEWGQVHALEASASTNRHGYVSSAVSSNGFAAHVDTYNIRACAGTGAIAMHLYSFSPFLCATFSPKHPSLLIAGREDGIAFIDVMGGDGDFILGLLKEEGPETPFCNPKGMSLGTLIDIRFQAGRAETRRRIG